MNHQCTLAVMETDWFYWSACSQQDKKLPSIPLWHPQIHSRSTVPSFGLLTAIEAGPYHQNDLSTGAQGRVGEAGRAPSA